MNNVAYSYHLSGWIAFSERFLVTTVLPVLQLDVFDTVFAVVSRSKRAGGNVSMPSYDRVSVMCRCGVSVCRCCVVMT